MLWDFSTETRDNSGIRVFSAPLEDWLSVPSTCIQWITTASDSTGHQHPMPSSCFCRCLSTHGTHKNHWNFGSRNTERRSRREWSSEQQKEGGKDWQKEWKEVNCPLFIILWTCRYFFVLSSTTSIPQYSSLLSRLHVIFTFSLINLTFFLLSQSGLRSVSNF